MASPESAPRDGAAVRVPPPLVHGLALGLGVGLHVLVLALPLGLGWEARVGLAALLGLGGLALAGAALRLFRRTGQDPEPWRVTPEIIRSGVYRLTRNPMYLGLALLQSAVGIGADNGWVLLLAPLASAIVHVIAVLPEEAYLERKFGDAYRDYKNSVRRWL